MRIDFGAGYRVYFVHRGETVYLLLAGGDKSTQTQDVRRAKSVVRALKETDAHCEREMAKRKKRVKIAHPSL